QKVIVPLHKLLVEMLHREVRVLVAEQTQHPSQLLPWRPLRRRAIEPTILEPFRPILLVPLRPALKRPHANTKHRGSLLLRDLTSRLLLQKPLKTHLTDSLVNARRAHFVPLSRDFLGHDTSRATNSRQITSYLHALQLGFPGQLTS